MGNKNRIIKVGWQTGKHLHSQENHQSGKDSSRDGTGKHVSTAQLTGGQRAVVGTKLS